MENTRCLEAIHELQITLTKLSAHSESEIGTVNTQGNLSRRINEISKSLENLQKLTTGEDGFSNKIHELQIELENIYDDIEKLEKWKQDMERIASIPQFEEMKKELEAQKSKWIIASTVFAVVQIITGVVIKYVLG